MRETHLKKNETTTATMHQHKNAQIKEDNVTSCVFELVSYSPRFFFSLPFAFHKNTENCKHNKQHAHRYASSSSECVREGEQKQENE